MDKYKIGNIINFSLDKYIKRNDVMLNIYEYEILKI